MKPLFLFREQMTPIRKLLLMKSVTGENLTEYTATSGNPVAFQTNVEKPLTQNIIHFSPVQSGSGDPSPENVRPITGWTGVKEYRTGKNLFDIDELWDNGTNRGTNEVNRYYKLVVPNGKYTVSTNVPNNTDYPSVASVFASSALINPASGPNGVLFNTPRTVTVTNGELYIYIRVSSSGGYLTWNKTSFAPYYIQVEIGQTAGTNEAYSGTTIPVTFPAGAGTVYGGNVDLVNGVIVAEYANIASYNGEELPGAWISDRDVYAQGTTPTTGAQVVYALATPIVYSIDPVSLSTLIGDNTIWSDANGNLEIKYLKKG